MQMWEVESGELIWSSVAETVMESETVTQDPVFLEDAIRLRSAALCRTSSTGEPPQIYSPE